MSHHSRTALASGALLAVAPWLLSGRGEASSAAPSARYGTSSSHSVSAGTQIPVALAIDLSTETASAGDVWHGTVTENARTLNGLIAAGSGG